MLIPLCVDSCHIPAILKNGFIGIEFQRRTDPQTHFHSRIGELRFSVFEAGEDTGIVLKEENVADDDSNALLAENGSNIQVREDGSYTFTVDLDAMSVSILKK